MSRVDDICRGTVYDTSSQAENIKAGRGCLLYDCRESRDDWAQGVEDTLRTWGGHFDIPPRSLATQSKPRPSLGQLSHSPNGWTPFAKLRWGIQNAGATKTSLSSDHPLWVRTWNLFSTPPPRGGTPRHQCQISSETGVAQVRQWPVDRPILGSIKRKGRPRVDVKFVKLVTELNGKYL